MKLHIKILVVLLSFLIQGAYAEATDDMESADSHFAAVTTESCPEINTHAVFEQRAWAAVLTPQSEKSDRYELKLQGARGVLIYFSELPFRQGRIKSSSFYRLWTEGGKKSADLSFKASAEALEMQKGKLRSTSVVLELSAPKYQDNTITYQAKLLSEVKLKSVTHLRDVTLLIQVPECQHCLHYPCLGC